MLAKQGNSVARDLPRTGSETNTTIFVIYTVYVPIDAHCASADLRVRVYLKKNVKKKKKKKSLQKKKKM